MPARILVIAEDADTARHIDRSLGEAGHLVTLVRDGAAGLEEVRMRPYRLVILDSASSGMSGIEFCRRLRGGGDRKPLFILGDSPEEFDRVLYLEMGADDYLAKPYSLRELVARVGALLRRTESLEAMISFGPRGSLRVNNLTIDVEKRSVILDREPLRLTAKEFDLLRLFAENPGKVFTRAELLRKVWGYRNDCYEHTVNSHINRLRAKIEQNSGRPHYILTVWGVGYKFRETDPEIP